MRSKNIESEGELFKSTSFSSACCVISVQAFTWIQVKHFWIEDGIADCIPWSLQNKTCSLPSQQPVCFCNPLCFHDIEVQQCLSIKNFCFWECIQSFLSGEGLSFWGGTLQQAILLDIC